MQHPPYRAFRTGCGRMRISDNRFLQPLPAPCHDVQRSWWDRCGGLLRRSVSLRRTCRDDRHLRQCKVCGGPRPHPVRALLLERGWSGSDHRVQPAFSGHPDRSEPRLREAPCPRFPWLQPHRPCGKGSALVRPRLVHNGQWRLGGALKTRARLESNREHRHRLPQLRHNARLCRLRRLFATILLTRRSPPSASFAPFRQDFHHLPVHRRAVEKPDRPWPAMLPGRGSEIWVWTSPCGCLHGRIEGHGGEGKRKIRKFYFFESQGNSSWISSFR